MKCRHRLIADIPQGVSLIGKGAEREAAHSERRMESGRQKVRYGGYSVMQGRTDESLLHGCCNAPAWERGEGLVVWGHQRNMNSPVCYA